MANKIKEVLMRRDGMSAEAADEMIMSAYQELQDRLAIGEDAYYICEEYFGLEPDYLMDLMDL